ncbi:MAG: hypothetical protein HY912_02415 [Desulfomonile tiedjei]|uniref:Uncharacterized protein n=1 Tax=Desulfomonile tiedjei TaxID=2358 RepID=A0A9D6Z222_9BACT|nr:hypothetical protein [Desulfomonile tiedjei]
MITDNEPVTSQDDEPVLIAPCTSGWRWFAAIFVAYLVFAAFYGGLYAFPLRGQYFRTACAIIGMFLLPPVWLDILLGKEIVFYPDRVEKVWHLLGRRAIPYNRAEVRGAAEQFRWLPKGYTIKEIGQDGKRRLMQIPIFYNARYVDPGIANQIDAIMAYMAAGPFSGPTRFTEATLPKEVVCQKQSY